jgi:hypothetical protein
MASAGIAVIPFCWIVIELICFSPYKTLFVSTLILPVEYIFPCIVSRAGGIKGRVGQMIITAVFAVVFAAGN